MAEKQHSVLIIDDDEFFREFYRSELSQHDFTVEFATDGEEGVAKALALKPEIIMLDIILPKKDGFEVLRDLKKDKSTKDIPVIITSTLGNNVDIHKLKEMGAINNFNKANTLPKDIALYIKDVLTHGVDQAKLSPEMEAEKESMVFTKTPKEKAKPIFEEGAKAIEKTLTELLSSKIVLNQPEITYLTFADLEAKINEISSSAGTILICSEIQAKKPSLVILSMKRDDALALIKLLEHGSLGNYLNPNKSEKIVENFFNIMLTALINKLSISLSSTILSKPPSIISPKDLVGTFQKLNAPKEDVAILMRVEYLIESISAHLSFNAFFSEETLVEQKSKLVLKPN